MLGRILGNYHVVSKIGEGGMGVVYLARHVTLGRPAAIKVLHPSLSSNHDMVTRFFNEARAATTVRNPGIVEVFDVGTLDDGSAYIVMEYLQGENLGARLRRGRMTVAATMTIIRAITRALQAAHEHGIVHRDLKPDNVFLVPDPDLVNGERIKLLDFGIAKLAPISGEVSQTRTGMVMGTPTYMAPEQCRGAGTVDHRADLYSLGCVAYQMLCGQPPFVSDGAGDLIARHLYFQPQALRTHVPDLPADIDELVLWLLQKEPSARPASAGDLVQAIDHLSAASVAGVMRTQPPAFASMPSPPSVVLTTLRGAASTVALQDGPPKRRVPLFAGIGAAVIGAAVLAFVITSRVEQPALAPAPPVAATSGRTIDPPAAPADPPAAPAAPPTPTIATPEVTPPSAPEVTPPPPPAVTAPMTVEPPAGDPPGERPERKPRGERGKHASRTAQRDADPPEPKHETPAPAPAPPVVTPPPPPSDPAPVAPPPPAIVRTPPPAVHRETPVVSATAVSKRSGVVPEIKLKGSAGDSAHVVAKLCIDEQGSVSSVHIVKSPPGTATELQRGLLDWRYAPYVSSAGVKSPVCFPVSFRIVFKG